MKDTANSARDVIGRARPFALTVLLVTAALTITLAGVRSIADIIGPVFLALVITVTLHPIRRRLERGRLPEWAASLVMLVAAYVLLFLLTLALIVSVARLADLLPQYYDNMTEAN
jgi:AI-2 transport protein TqsA